MQPLKIICFLFDPNIGGPTVRARTVYSLLMQDGYNVRVAFPTGEGSAISFLEEKSINVDKLNIAKPTLPRKIMPFLKYFVTMPLSLYRLVSYLRSSKPDVIHVNGAFDMLPAIAGRLVNVPVVWHLNDTVFGPKFSSVLGMIVRLVATEIVIAAQCLGEYYGISNSNIHVVYAPVDVEKYYKRASPSIKNNIPVLCMIGNWNWIKGQDRFVDVISYLLKRKISVSGLIVGKFLPGQKNFWQPIMEHIERANLAATIKTPGFSSDIPQYLEHCDVFLLTSHSEACPISLLEAMAMGVPAVAFDVGGVTELLGLGDNAAGIPIEPGDTKAMSAAIERLLGDAHLYRMMSLNGQTRARELYSVEICTRRHKEVYSIATKRKSRLRAL